MTLAREDRDQLAQLRRKIKDIEAPEWEAARQKKRKADREARKRVGKRSEGQRQPREQDKGYLAFLRRQPCSVGHLGGCGGRIDPAHLRFTDRSVGRVNPGMGRKSHDYWCVSLCRTHHDAQHAYGNEAKWWSDVVGANPNEVAARLFAEYQGNGR